MNELKRGYSHILEDPQRIAEFVKKKVDSKLRWCEENLHRYQGSSWACWQDMVLELFYKGNLSIETPTPQDGEVVCKQGNVLVIDWRSPCPILETCLRHGDDPVQVCSTPYHVQYQALLSEIEEGLFFARDYSQLRPKTDHCREVIIRRPGR